MSKLTFLIGTYTNGDSKGIYKATFDTYDGTMQTPNLYYEIEEPKFIIQQSINVVSTVKKQGKAGLALLDTTHTLLHCKDSVYHEKTTACYVTCRNTTVVSVNYHEGNILIYEVLSGKLHLEHKFSLGLHAKCHQAFFHEQYLFVVCLGLDEIKIYDSELDYEEIKSIPLPKGTGPRQAVLDKDGTHLYVLTEVSNEIYTFKKSRNMDFKGIQINTVLPQGCKTKNASAAICINQDGQHLYTTTRGANIITVFEIERGYLKPAQFVECGGDHPREMKLDPTSSFLLVANRYSNSILSFRLDLTGLIYEQCDEIKVSEPCCIEFI